MTESRVQILQTDVIDLLRQITSLMYRASEALKSDKTAGKYAGFHQEVADATQNVEKLELRMAIVAPMKAGKSTIINAIIGQDILPSRNAAMTTLPTEIVFDAKLAEPKLTLNSELLSVLQKTFLALQHQIRHLDSERRQKKMEQYPHLIELSRQIEAGEWGFLINAVTCERENIVKALTGLNDIVRLCSLIAPDNDPLRQLIDLPCIETPFWRSPANEKSEKLGNLVIIDTPGPNEAGENLKLKGVVEEELRKSSIVLIVLDFTQLKTEAAEKVKKDVQKVINLRGKENLYVLINKVDQRRDSDMTPEQVRQFVAAEFGIGHAEDTDRVFEIAARRAFVAANFMQELEQNPDLKPQDMQTGRALAQEVFGIDWEEDLEEATLEEIHKKAQRLWKKSGFDPFLEKALKALMERAAPRCMSSALKLSRNHLVALLDDVNLRNRAIAEDAEKLRREVGALNNDLGSLETCRTRLKEVDTIKLQLNRNLQIILQNLKEAAKVSLEDYFTKEERQRAEGIKKLDIQAREFFLTSVGNFEIFPKWLSRHFKSAVEFKSSGLFEFNSEWQAEEFAAQAIAYAKERADTLLSGVRDKVGKEVEQARTGLSNFLDKETKPIIERAQTRLKQAFNINLSLPQPSLNQDELKLVKPRVKTQTRHIDQGYEEKVVEKRHWWHWLWVVPYKETVRVKRPDKKENYYTVSLQELIISINQSIEEGINSINQGINKYLDEDFQQRVDTFFESLENYLSNYRDSLVQAQADQRLSLEEKENLVAELGYLVPKATEYIQEADKRLKQTNELIEEIK